MKKLLCSALIIMAAAFQAVAGSADAVREEWRQTWRSLGVDPAVAESVVWPEMQRYSPMRDVVETAADYGFYVLGEDSPDYSIGIFQMRPSFVEDLEKAWMGSGLAEEFNLAFDTADTAAARHMRINRMNSSDWQVVYVGVFLRMLYHCYGLDALSAEDHVRLAATAYNRGCAWTDAGRGSVERLRRNSNVKSFSLAGPGRTPSQKYCYATLAWEHYQSITE